MKHYTGADLSEGFKEFFRKEKNRITKYLKQKGCTNIQMSCQFHYFYGFFTSASGQIYYFNCSDVRRFGYHQLMYRTAKSYTDWTGGYNCFTSTSADGLRKMNVQ